MQPGDIVAIKHGIYGRKEGLVIGSHIDYAVSAQIIPFLLLLILIGRFFVCLSITGPTNSRSPDRTR